MPNLSKSDPNRFITTREAAEMLSVSTRTIDRYRDSGLLPSFAPSPRVVRVRQGDVIAMMEKSRIATYRPSKEVM